MDDFKFEATFKLSNGAEVTLNAIDMMNISDTYKIMCTQEFLLEYYPDLGVKEAKEIAAEVHRQMDKYDFTEEEAIDEVFRSRKDNADEH